MEYHAYSLLKGSCFEILGDEKYDLFLSQKVDGNMIFTDYWKVLLLKFSIWEIPSFFSRKVDREIMFTWYFWAFYDIPGLGKYGLSYSENC